MNVQVHSRCSQQHVTNSECHISILMLSSYLRLEYMICTYQVFRPNSVIISHHFIALYTSSRFRWSRGSVLAFAAQVRGFDPGRSLRLFRGETILSTPSFGREVKPFIRCRRFPECHLEAGHFQATFIGHFSSK